LTNNTRPKSTLTYRNRTSPPEPYLVEHNSYVGNWSCRQLWRGNRVESARCRMSSEVTSVVQATEPQGQELFRGQSFKLQNIKVRNSFKGSSSTYTPSKPVTLSRCSCSTHTPSRPEALSRLTLQPALPSLASLVATSTLCHITHIPACC